MCFPLKGTPCTRCSFLNAPEGNARECEKIRASGRGLRTHPLIANLILRLPLSILLTPGALICSLASMIPRLENGKEMSATQATFKEVSVFKGHKQHDHIII